jgi:hypothetical protein
VVAVCGEGRCRGDEREPLTRAKLGLAQLLAAPGKKPGEKGKDEQR